jgi:hypothetical protein
MKEASHWWRKGRREKVVEEDGKAREGGGVLHFSASPMGSEPCEVCRLSGTRLRVLRASQKGGRLGRACDLRMGCVKRGQLGLGFHGLGRVI